VGRIPVYHGVVMSKSAHNSIDPPFWESCPLENLTETQWESLCDRCGRCCVHKLQDDETDEVFVTDIACELLDLETCCCSDYANRKQTVPDCLRLTPQLARCLDWLPPTCAYRRLAEGKGLPQWHPLVTGNLRSALEAGMSALNRVITMDQAAEIYGEELDES
jgi:uncharacterized cysteine cluster protein YcgN (CxxCxxCC family)